MGQQNQNFTSSQLDVSQGSVPETGIQNNTSLQHDNPLNFTPGDYSNYRKGTALILGGAQLVMGFVCFIVGIIAVAISTPVHELYGIYGMVGGAMFLAAGALGVCSYKYPTYQIITSFLSLSVFSLVASLAGFVAGGYFIWWESNYHDCYRCDPDQGRIALSAILTVCSIIELAASLWSCLVGGVVCAAAATKCCIAELGCQCHNCCYKLYGNLLEPMRTNQQPPPVQYIVMTANGELAAGVLPSNNTSAPPKYTPGQYPASLNSTNVTVIPCGADTAPAVPSDQGNNTSNLCDRDQKGHPVIQ